MTKYYKAEGIYYNASIGDTEDCIYVTIPADDIFDTIRRLLEHLQCEPGKDYTYTIPCTLKRCMLYGIVEDKDEVDTLLTHIH
jgi:hypothetical protein